MQRWVEFGDGHGGAASLGEPLLRHPRNPILTAHHVNAVWRAPDRRVVTVHNAGVAREARETVMLFRSHLRSGVSVIGRATSADGIGGWRVDPEPALAPATLADRFAPGVDPAAIVEMESGGVEDPRINRVDGTFAITYSAYHGRVKDEVRVCLAVSDDLRTFTRYGPVLDRDMRNVVLFPDRFAAGHAGLFRPNDALAEIRLGYADDVRGGRWTIEAEPVLRTGGGPSAFSDKIGPGAPPVRTDRGWLNLFHGVRSTMDGNPYVLGIALHDLADPARVLMSGIPVLFPTRADCRVADTDYVHVPNVVFSCAMLRRDDGTMLVYYGGNDTVMNVAATHEDVLVELCVRYPAVKAT